MRSIAFALLMMLAAGSASAQSSDQTNAPERLVERSVLVLDEFLQDPAFEHMRVYVQNAYGVIVFPRLIKGGFVLGAEGGSGALLVRNIQTGQWSPPVFYDLFGVSLGLQIGGKASAVVVTIMNSSAIDRILTNKVKLGADASVAAGPVGAGVGAATTLNFGEDLYVFARAVGAFGGASVEGAGMFGKPGWNELYYGQAVDVRDVIGGSAVQDQKSMPLRERLNQF
ncbi:MAG: lipid-binding SYLF domain-containing protein [Geminicoccaceae bacterium]